MLGGCVGLGGAVGAFTTLFHWPPMSLLDHCSAGSGVNMQPSVCGSHPRVRSNSWVLLPRSLTQSTSWSRGVSDSGSGARVMSFTALPLSLRNCCRAWLEAALHSSPFWTALISSSSLCSITSSLERPSHTARGSGGPSFSSKVLNEWSLCFSLSTRGLFFDRAGMPRLLTSSRKRASTSLQDFRLESAEVSGRFLLDCLVLVAVLTAPTATAALDRAS